MLVSGPLYVQGLKSQRPTCSRVVWRSKAAFWRRRQVAQPSMLQHETACWPGYTDLIILPLHSKIITIYQL